MTAARVDEKTVESFMEALLDTYQQAAEVIAPQQTSVDLGGIPVSVETAGGSLHPRITRMLVRSSRRPSQTDGRILAFDVARTRVLPPKPPWRQDTSGFAAGVRGLPEGRFLAESHAEPETFALCDRSRRVSVYWSRYGDGLYRSLESAPLRAQLRWLGMDRGLHLMHAAAVGRGRDGLLLMGAGGAGKSTTAFAAMLAGMAFVSDDFCVLRPEPDGSTTVMPLVTIGRAMENTLRLLPGLAERVVNRGAPADHKAEIELTDVIAPALTVRALGVPVQDRASGAPRRVPAGTFVRKVLLGTMSAYPGMADVSFRFLARLAEALPCFELPVGPDLAGVEDLIDGALSMSAQVPA
ncbi:MAG: hypothetical protein ACRDL5_06980 [Solirubrobacteraceae bacterium]